MRQQEHQCAAINELMLGDDAARVQQQPIDSRLPKMTCGVEDGVLSLWGGPRSGGSRHLP